MQYRNLFEITVLFGIMDESFMTCSDETRNVSMKRDINLVH